MADSADERRRRSIMNSRLPGLAVCLLLVVAPLSLLGTGCESCPGCAAKPARKPIPTSTATATATATATSTATTTATPTATPTPGVSGSITVDTTGQQSALGTTVPFGTSDGQFMFATVIMQGAGVGSDFIKVPTGWTELVQTGCGTDFRQSISYRVASGDVWPTSAYTWLFCTANDANCVLPSGSSLTNVYATGSIVNFTDVDTVTPVQSGTGA